MTNEEIISDFMRKHYTDEKLAALLAHAEDAKLSFFSCCCVAGIPTAQHALQGVIQDGRPWREHGPTYNEVPDGRDVSSAFGGLAKISGTDEERDAERRAKIIPLIRAEIERRERERSKSSSPVDIEAVVV